MADKPVKPVTVGDLLNAVQDMIHREGPAIDKEVVVLLPEGKIRKGKIVYMIDDQAVGVEVTSAKNLEKTYSVVLPTPCVLAPFTEENFTVLSKLFGEGQALLHLSHYAYKGDVTSGLDLAGKFVQKAPSTVQ